VNIGGQGAADGQTIGSRLLLNDAPLSGLPPAQTR
jgi:hypothetical protein